MSRTLTDKQSMKLAKLLILMGVPKETRLEVLTAIETPQELRLFLHKLSEKNYEMTPEEVYQASVKTNIELSNITE